MKIIYILTIIILISIKTVYSKNADPIAFLTNIINESKLNLKTKNDIFIEKKINDYINFDEMCIWITGKQIWENEDKNIKNDFKKEIKKLILKTYNKTIYHYIDSDIIFEKYIDNNKDTKRIQIYSKIKKNNKIINVSYRLIKNDNSWLIFDIVIEGISILKSLKIQFNDLIKLKGLQQTINKLYEINNEKQ